MEQKTKPIIRFYYSPMCNEALMAKHQLNNLFQPHSNVFDYQAISIWSDDVDCIPKNTPASAFFQKLQNNLITFNFARLFINWEPIPMPKLHQHLQQYFENHALPFDATAFQNFHGKWEAPIVTFDLHELHVEKVVTSNIKTHCSLCSKANLYIPPNCLPRELWDTIDAEKEAFLIENKDALGYVGFTALHQNNAVGMIEALPLNQAKRNGFPVKEHPNTLMITCLHIGHGATGLGLSKKLYKALESEAKQLGFCAIQVVAYPAEYNWQPESFYQKQGFKQAIRTESFCIMEKTHL